MGPLILIMRQLAGASVMLLVAMLAIVPADAATQTAAAKAVTLRPLSIVNTRDLDFGGLIPTAGAGTVVVDPLTDARVTTGGAVAAGGSPGAARFVTAGGPLQFVVISRGALPVLNRVGGGATMTVTDLTLNGTAIRFLNTLGVLDLRIGGTLAVAANQPDGLYQGSFTITVTYF